MIHQFKNSSRRITRQYLCYDFFKSAKLGKADHKYDAVRCGFNLSDRPHLFHDGVYTGPIMGCIHCHRQLWWAETDRNRCPQCMKKIQPASTSRPDYINRLPQDLIDRVVRGN